MVALSDFLGPKSLKLDVQPPAQILSPEQYLCLFSHAVDGRFALVRLKWEKVNKINKKG